MSSAPGPSEGFSFKTGDLVLVKWNDGMVYFAKIKKIDKKRRTCIVVFDDKSQDQADFSQVHSVDETTTDIICIRCKRDDSDVPNEIVLCDTCGIGFHQRCHHPPIPASALELDTPWNCMYCQKGVKCPFLTESLDVLQTLLSDEEEGAQDQDEKPDVITIESDHEVAEEFGPKSISPRKSRKGKKSAESRTPKNKRLPQRGSPEKKSVAPLSAQAWKHKLASTDSGRMPTPPSAPSPTGDDAYSTASSSTPNPSLGRKRKSNHHSSGSFKRHKRSSVESRTVSVTRLPVPICEDSSTSEQEPSHESSTLSESESSIAQVSEPLPTVKEEPLSPEERPRSLRVSLSLPDEVETGSPFRKIASPPNRVEGILKSPGGPQPSTLPSTLPSWEDISTSVATSRDSPPLAPNTVFPLSPTTIGATVDLPTAPMPASPPRQETDRKRKPSDLQLETATKKVSPPAKHVPPAVPTPTTDDVFLSSTTVCTTTTKSVASPQSTFHHIQTTSKPKLNPPVRKAAIVSTTTAHSLSHAAAKQHIHTVTKTHLPAATPVIKSDSPITAVPRATPFTATPLPQPQVPDKKRPASLPKPTSVVVTPGTSPQVTGTPEFTQANPTNLITSTPTSTQPLPNQGQKKPGTLTPGRAQSKKLPPSATASPSQTPVQTLVSSAMSTALASVVGGINNSEPEGQQKQQTDAPQLSSRSSGPSLVSTSDGDVVITGVETKLPVSSAEHTQKQASSAHVTSQRLSPQQERPQDLYHKRTSDSAPKKVVAKTVEIQPGSASAKPIATPTQGAGAIVMPIASQTPVTVVPMVVTPTAYTSKSQDGTPTTYLIPAVGQNGQQMFVPAGNIVVSPNPHQYVVRDPPPYTPPAVSASPTLPTAAKPSSSVAYTQPVHTGSIHMIPANHHHQQHNNVAYYTTSAPTIRTPQAADAPVSTTKPYAVVPALPTAHAQESGDYRVPMQQQSGSNQTTVYMQPVNGSHSIPVIQNATTAPVKGPKSAYHTNPPRRPPILQKSTPVSSRPPLLHGAVGRPSPPQEKVAQYSEELKTITTKIGAAFANCSEEMLISAFEDAWKKFQANGKKYEALRNISKPHATSAGRVSGPPNVEVVNVPGASSRLSLVRPARPKPIAPKVASPVLPPPTASTQTPQQQQESPQYIYTYGNTSQPQVIYQPMNPEYAIYAVGGGSKQKAYQVQTAGLFYPAPASDGKQEPSVPQQVVIAQPPVQPPPPPPGHPDITKTTAMAHSATGPRRNTNPRRRASSKLNRVCALCGKEATYLCSGCHAEWYCGRPCQLKAWDKHSEQCQD